MEFKKQVVETGKIPTYYVENEEKNLIGDLNKPSARIYQTKIGLKTIDLLKKIEQYHNHSWYKEIYSRNYNNTKYPALFYRGRKVSYQEMFMHVDEFAKSFSKLGLKKGDEISCCLANTPELVYIMLAANRIGIKLNLFGTNLAPEYLQKIMKNTSSKLFISTDNNYGLIKDSVDKIGFENKLIVSLADSLPENPKLCDEYVEELDDYYHYDNLVPLYKQNDDRIVSVNEFVKYGFDYDKEIIDDNDLNTEFTITYTSGSTSIGYPKQIIHSNRSYIIGGIYNDTNLTGSPSVPEIRGLAHIHSDSNTNLVTCISDNLIKRGTVALEPEYDKKKALDYIILNKPVHLDATTSFLIEVAKKYFKEYKNKGKKLLLPQMLVTMAVGEKTSPGEEKFLNKFLKCVKAGSGISLNGLKLPYAPLSIGGGDCEHGGIYYTLLQGLQRPSKTLKIGNNEFGMIPVPFSTVTALKQLPDGSYTECNYEEMGVIVANSLTSMVGYKDANEKTINKIITDDKGRDWLSCDVYGYINKLGNVVVRGRKEYNIVIDNATIPAYIFDEIALKDTKNIMSCSTVASELNGETVPVLNVEFSPLKKISDYKALLNLKKRFEHYLPKYIADKIVIRIIDNEKSYPLTGSGKRNIPALKQMDLVNTIKFDGDYIFKVNNENLIDDIETSKMR